ncbi:MAG: KTSC domain-containing protein [Chloroflexi bacterium]|nr:KTSC domain-containing protein [Chloroflexota bacterium]
MRLIIVESSLIYAIGYDAGTKVLEVVLKNELTYQYDGVPPEVHEQFMQAESKGKFFVGNVRDAYPCYQVRGRG